MQRWSCIICLFDRSFFAHPVLSNSRARNFKQAFAPQTWTLTLLLQATWHFFRRKLQVIQLRKCKGLFCTKETYASETSYVGTPYFDSNCIFLLQGVGCLWWFYLRCRCLWWFYLRCSLERTIDRSYVQGNIFCWSKLVLKWRWHSEECQGETQKVTWTLEWWIRVTNVVSRTESWTSFHEPLNDRNKGLLPQT